MSETIESLKIRVDADFSSIVQSSQSLDDALTQTDTVAQRLSEHIAAVQQNGLDSAITSSFPDVAFLDTVQSALSNIRSEITQTRAAFSGLIPDIQADRIPLFDSITQSLKNLYGNINKIISHNGNISEQVQQGLTTR